MRGQKILECIAAVSVTVVMSVGRPTAAVPEYACLQTLTPITIDGRLDEPAWKGAETVSFQRTETTTPTKFPTTAKMLWDENAFYIAWVCDDPDIWTTKFTKDEDLWTEEVVEIFIDPDADSKGYLELEVNPANTFVDLKIAKVGQVDAKWDIKGLKTAVTVEGTLGNKTDNRTNQDTRWTVEVAIPWTGMADIPPGITGPPKDGTTWRVNLYRIDLAKAGTEGDDEYLAWSPTGKVNFHMPDKFGIVRFTTAQPTEVKRTGWGVIKKEGVR